MGYQFNLTVKGNSEIELINNLISVLRSRELYVATKAEIEALNRAQINLKETYKNLYYENTNGSLIPKEEERSDSAGTLCRETYSISDIISSIQKRDGKQR